MSPPSSSGPAPAWRLWRNPILRRYCRTRLRPRGLGAALIITLLVAGFIFAFSRIMGIQQMESAQRFAAMHPKYEIFIPTMEGIERYCLLPLMALQGFILFIIGTGQVAGGMTADADEGTMDYMRLSPMTPLAKVFGYLFGLPVREWIMFASTLPFTAWGIWRGAVPASCWVPVYAVILTAAVLYHLTGLTAGTVLRNRRWAFLVAMGGVFLLYTVVPQLANVGLVYFEYLTIWPVLTENMYGFMPDNVGAAMKAVDTLVPEVGFFTLGFPEAVFTIFSQLVLCLTFIVMLWRRWRRAESHLLGKAWATGLCIWIQIVLLGCSQPLINSGLLFITRRFSMRFTSFNRGWNMSRWSADLNEALLMTSLYGTVTLLTIILLALMIAPGREAQARGAHRAVKIGRRRSPFFGDDSPSLLFVTAMAVTGAAGWAIFAHLLISSRWFPGQELPPWTPAVFGVVLLTASLCCVLEYELWGAKGVFLGVIFAGVVPILTGVIMASAARELSTTSVWIGSASPLTAPSNASAIAIPDGVGHRDALRLAGPRAFAFWQGAMVIAAAWMMAKHRALHRARHLAARAAGEIEKPDPGLTTA